jgi:hypothetical protein
MDPSKFHTERSLAKRLLDLSAAEVEKATARIDLSREIETVHQEWKTILDELSAEFPDYVALRQGEPLSFAKVVRLLI